ncbi:MAG: CapA family protein [Cyclobacteriaceae bacterium]|nr:CapA family protein [Cyclobacteriaceae bacterium]
MSDALTIGITGDVMLGRTLDRIISQRGFDYPWGDLLPLMKETDFNLINLETTLTNSERKVYKTFNFRSDPENIQSLINANIAVANLANNHIKDFAGEGLLETIETLDAAGIKHVGAGRNRDDALEPAVIMEKGIIVGFLGLTDNEPGWIANHGPGINYVDLTHKEEKARILHSIENLSKEADIIIVSIHWGDNMREKPEPGFVNFAHAMVGHGANVIHGHSAHILQGIEYYHNSLILYDTGDFVDDYAVDPELRNDLSAFFTMKVDKSGVLNLKLVPTRIFDYQVNRAMHEDHEWVIQRIKKLSSVFDTQIDNQGNLDVNQSLYFQV